MKAILIATMLSTGNVSTMAFQDYMACVEYANRNSGRIYQMECVPASDKVAEHGVKGFYKLTRVIGIFRK